MKDIRAHIAERLNDHYGGLTPDPLKLIKRPEEDGRGDFALPCFAYTRRFQKTPNVIAWEMADVFSQDELFSKVENDGPFLNFTIDAVALSARLLPAIIGAGPAFGSQGRGAGRWVVIDFSSPNIAKPIAIHHIRSTVIGNSLALLFEKLGYRVARINFLGDWGTQFGKLLSAYSRWGDAEALERDGIRHLLDLYVRFHTEAEKDPALESEARDWFRRAEADDPEALGLWRRFRDISIREFERIYRRMGVTFDAFEGESCYREGIDGLIGRIHETAGTRLSEGALIVDLETEKLPPLLLRKEDGTTLYATRDIAAAIDRFERFDFDRSLYIVASQQNLHFQQLFAVLQRMGLPWASRCRHIPFGMVSFADDTMSTRRGKVVFLEEVLDRAVELSLAAIREKNEGLADAQTVAEQVGIGAVIFGELDSRRQNDVVFDWAQVLNFNGETGVYVQYTHARACSVLRKANVDRPDPGRAVWKRLTSEHERELVKALARFPETIEQAAELYEPYLVARGLIELCRVFNRFYFNTKVIVPEPDLFHTRLALVYAAREVIREGLRLLGMQAPVEM